MKTKQMVIDHYLDFSLINYFILTGAFFVAKDTPVLGSMALVETFSIVLFSRNVLKME